jgi:hypothetical protein
LADIFSTELSRLDDRRLKSAPEASELSGAPRPPWSAAWLIVAGARIAARLVMILFSGLGVGLVMVASLSLTWLQLEHVLAE